MHVLQRKGGMAQYSAQILAYIQWVTKVQQDSDPNNMDTEGEPKYYLSGQVYDQPWCRPQNDGPALRAIALIAIANELLTMPAYGKAWVQQHLYDETLSNPLPIKRDLEFVSHHWTDDCCDPWEEISG
jgi:glucoamylase